SGTFFRWSPDGSLIAYTASQRGAPQAAGSAPAARKESSSVVIYNGGKVHHSETTLSEIWTIDVQTGVSKKIAAFPAEPFMSPAWSSDGKTLFCGYYF